LFIINITCFYKKSCNYSAFQST